MVRGKNGLVLYRSRLDLIISAKVELFFFFFEKTGIDFFRAIRNTPLLNIHI